MTKRMTSNHIWLGAGGLSVVVHIGFAWCIATQNRSQVPKTMPVSVKIVEQPVIAKPEPPAPLPPPPKEKPKPKPKPPKVASERKSPPPNPNRPPPKPIQGLAPDAMTAGGKVAVPLGNTLMVEDTGERLKEAPDALQGDLSAEPELIYDSVIKPEYTQAAIEAGLEGAAIVEVLVEETGRVLEAELKRRIGFGMDERILTSAKGARFKPRRNRFGKAESGWTEIKFTLQLP